MNEFMHKEPAPRSVDQFKQLAQDEARLPEIIDAMVVMNREPDANPELKMYLRTVSERYRLTGVFADFEERLRWDTTTIIEDAEVLGAKAPVESEGDQQDTVQRYFKIGKKYDETIQGLLRSLDENLKGEDDSHGLNVVNDALEEPEVRPKALKYLAKSDSTISLDDIERVKSMVRDSAVEILWETVVDARETGVYVSSVDKDEKISTAIATWAQNTKTALSQCGEYIEEAKTHIEVL